MLTAGSGLNDFQGFLRPAGHSHKQPPAAAMESAFVCVESPRGVRCDMGVFTAGDVGTYTLMLAVVAVIGQTVCSLYAFCIATMQVRSFLVTVARHGPAAGLFDFGPYWVLQPCSDKTPVAPTTAATTAGPVSAAAGAAARAAPTASINNGGGGDAASSAAAAERTVTVIATPLHGAAHPADDPADTANPAASEYQDNDQTPQAPTAPPLQPPPPQQQQKQRQQVQRQATSTLQKEGAAAAAALVTTPTQLIADTAAAAAGKPNVSHLHLLPHPPSTGRAIPLSIVLLWRLPLCVAAVAVASLIMRTARIVSGSGKGSNSRLSRPVSHGRLGVGRLR
jgi:hypothetical protein